MKPSQLLWLTSLGFAACTMSDAVRPSDMSVAGHERAARANDAMAAQQDGKYDPDAETSRLRCHQGGSRLAARVIEPCWTSSTNPTAHHAQEAEWFRSVAQAHREAAQTLRDAEATACIGVSADDRDESPLAHSDDILSTDVKSNDGRTTGVTILVRGVPGMSWDYLTRTVGCQLARNQATGFAMGELAFDPLNVKGAKVTVEAFAPDFRITISSDDESTANEIAARATRLMSRPDYPMK